MDFDYTWKVPTEAQVAALAHACRCLGSKWEEFPRPHTWHDLVVARLQHRAHLVDAGHCDYVLDEFDLAELMLTADNSLWYTQAKTWKDEPPTRYGNSYKRITQFAAAFVCRVVEWGYRDGKWWDLETMYPDMGLRVLGISCLLEFNRMTYRITHIHRAKQALAVLMSKDGGPLVSPGFRTLPTLLVPKLNVAKISRLLSDTDTARLGLAEIQAYFDPEFKKQMAAAKRDAQRTAHDTYEPTECTHPECKNLVAPTGVKPREGHHKNYRGTGACRRGHNSYFCTRCGGPHSYTSQRGRDHYDLYYGKDWDGTDMGGEKWQPT